MRLVAPFFAAVAVVVVGLTAASPRPPSRDLQPRKECRGGGIPRAIKNNPASASRFCSTYLRVWTTMSTTPTATALSTSTSTLPDTTSETTTTTTTSTTSTSTSTTYLPNPTTTVVVTTSTTTATTYFLAQRSAQPQPSNAAAASKTSEYCSCMIGHAPTSTKTVTAQEVTTTIVTSTATTQSTIISTTSTTETSSTTTSKTTILGPTSTVASSVTSTSTTTLTLPYPSQVVQNPSFETGSGPGGAPPWTGLYFGNPFSFAITECDSTLCAYDGARFLDFVGDSPGGTTQIQQTLQGVQIGKQYTLSAYVGYYDAGVSGNRDGSQITVLLDGATVVPKQYLCGSQAPAPCNTHTTPYSGWRQISGLVTPTSANPVLTIRMDIFVGTDKQTKDALFDLATLTVV